MLILFLFFGTLANAQVTIQWQKTLGESNGDQARSIQQTSDGGYVIAGYSTFVDSGGGLVIMVQKTIGL